MSSHKINLAVINCMLLGLLIFPFVNSAPITNSTRIKIGSLYSNTTADFGWNYSLDQAIGGVERNLLERGYEVEREIHIQPKIENVLDIMKNMIDNNVHIIYVTSNDYSDALKTLRTLGGNYNTTPIMSVQPYDLGYHHAGTNGRAYTGRYLAGVMCGSLGADKVGYMAPKPGGGTYNQILAFYIGVKKFNPNAELYVLFTNDWYDPVLEYKSAQRMVTDWGIKCATGSLDATKAWHEMNIPSTAYFSDASTVVGENVYFSVIYKWSTPFQQAMDLVLNDTYFSGNYIYGKFGDQIDISYYSTKMPVNIKKVVDSERRKLLAASGETIFCPPYLNGFYTNGTGAGGCLGLFQIIYMKHFRLADMYNPYNLTHEEIMTSLFVQTSSGLAISFQVIAALLIAICIVLILHVAKHQHTAIIRSASPLFLAVILFGWVLLLISVFMWSGVPTNDICLSRIWLAGMGWSIVYAALWAKNYRIVEILTNESMRVFAITRLDLLVRVGICVVVEAIILIVWSTVDQYKVVQSNIGYNLTLDQRNIVCASTYSWGIGIFLAYKFVLVCINGALAWKARVIQHDYFNESGPLALSVYTSLLVGIIAIAIITSTPYTTSLEAGIITYYIIIIAIAFLVAMFVPKIYALHIVKDDKAWSQELQSVKVGQTSFNPVTSHSRGGSSTKQASTTSSSDGGEKSPKISPKSNGTSSSKSPRTNGKDVRNGKNNKSDEKASKKKKEVSKDDSETTSEEDSKPKKTKKQKKVEKQEEDEKQDESSNSSSSSDDEDDGDKKEIEASSSEKDSKTTKNKKSKNKKKKMEEV